MTTSLFPQEIQNVLELLAEQGFEDTWQGLDRKDQELTRSLCCSDTCDFIVLVDGDAFLFTEVGSGWEVSHVGRPVFEVEQEMISDDSVGVDEFILTLQEYLEGVEIRKGSALNNARSKFVQQFRTELDAAFDSALSEY